MLNYSAIIQAIIKQYKKHTKYVFSLLLLSVFVASFVSSALTKPAISMTNEMDSQLALQFTPSLNSKLMSLKGAAGSLETIDVPYSESIFKNYMSDTAGKITNDLYLGVATRFHLFAFDTVTINVHCNGNIITPNLVSQANYGTNQIRGDGVNDNEISIVTNSFSGNYNTIDNYMLFGSGMNVSYSNGTYSLNGNTINTPNVYKVTSNFIDISAQKAYYTKLSKDLSELTSSTNDFKYSRETPNNPSITIKNESADSAKIINLTAKELLTYNNGNLHNNTFQINTSSVSPIIINVDMAGYGSDVTIPFELLLYVNNTQIPISEANVANGTNILWNFYDSSASNKNYTGKITTAKAFKGCILAPNASVETLSNIDGNIIANTIKTGGESHNVMFMTPYTKTPPIGTDGGDDPPQTALIVKKTWNNCTAPGDIFFDLYRSHTQTTDGSIPADAVKISQNDWCGASASWQSSKNVDASENGNPWYYYAKEISVNAGGANAISNYDVTYSGNGSTSSDTITITIINTPKGTSPPPDEKINIEVTKQWNMSESHPTYIAYSLYRSKTYQSSGLPNDRQSVYGNYQYIGNNDSFHATHSNLDKYDSTDSQPWYYYVEETAVEANDGSQGKLNEYNATYTNNGLNNSGTITITNTPNNASPPPEEKITINVNKIWSDGNENHNNEIMVYLKESSDNINWHNYSEQYIILSIETNWQGSFTDIPKNDKYYRVEEIGALGYTPSYSKDSIKASDASETENITITNTKQTASLTIKKIWQGVESNDLSHDVKNVVVSVYRNKVSPTISLAPMKSVSPFSLMSGKLLKSGNDTFTSYETKYLSNGNLANNGDTEVSYFLGDYAGKTVSSVHIEFNQSIDQNVYIMFGESDGNNLSNYNGYFTQIYNNSNALDWNGNGKQIQSNTYLLITDNSKRTDIAVTKAEITFTGGGGGNMNLQMQFNWLDSSGNTTSSLSDNVQFQLYYADKGITDLNQLTDDKKATNIQNNLITLGSGQYTWNNLPIENGKAYYVKELTTGDWTTSYSNNGMNQSGTIVINNRVNSSGGGGSGGGSSDGDPVTFGERTARSDYGYDVWGRSNLIVYDLSEYIGRKVIGIDIVIDNNTNGVWGYLGSGSFVQKSSQYLNNGKTNLNSAMTISNDSCLFVFPEISTVKSLTLYLEPDGSGGTTTTTTTTSATTTATSTTTTTTAAPLQQPGGRELPPNCEFVDSVTLDAGNSWQYTLSDLDLYADNKLYEYYIIETNINLNSGAANTYRIYGYSLNEGLALLPNGTNELSVTNIYNTSGFIMPSTGGVGADVYYHTGFIMMIASGGIYITFAFIRKRRSLMSLKE